MKDMRSAVCKKANELVKIGYSKRQAFVKAWAEAKYAAKCIKGSDLTAGDRIVIEYGMAGNFCRCTVSKVSEYNSRNVLVVAVSENNGREIDFVCKRDELVEKAA